MIPAPEATARTIVVGRVSRSHYVALASMHKSMLFCSTELFLFYCVGNPAQSEHHVVSSAPTSHHGPASTDSYSSQPPASLAVETICPSPPSDYASGRADNAEIIGLMRQLYSKVADQQKQLERQKQQIQHLILPPPKSLSEKGSKSANPKKGFGIDGIILMTREYIAEQLRIKQQQKQSEQEAKEKRKRERESKRADSERKTKKARNVNDKNLFKSKPKAQTKTKSKIKRNTAPTSGAAVLAPPSGDFKQASAVPPPLPAPAAAPAPLAPPVAAAAVVVAAAASSAQTSDTDNMELESQLQRHEGRRRRAASSKNVFAPFTSS